MAIDTNMPNPSSVIALATSERGPLVDTLCHRMHDRVSAAPAVVAVTKAYRLRGQRGVSAPTTSSTSAPPSNTSSGERANQSIDGPTNRSAAVTAEPPERA